MRISQRVRASSYKRYGYALFAVFSTALMALSYTGSASASYNQWCNFNESGRHGCDGYYTGDNMYDPTADFVRGSNVIIPAGGGLAFGNVNSATTFITDVKNYLNQGSAATYNWNSVGAAFIIDNMLGVSGGSLCSGSGGHCNWSNGVSYAESHLNIWEARVNGYESKGWVNWSSVASMPLGTVDSEHTCLMQRGVRCGTAAERNTPGWDEHDIAFRRNNSDQVAALISFHNPNGSVFRLRRDCGNVVGPVDPIVNVPPPTANLQPSVSASTQYADDHSTVIFTYTVTNTGGASVNGFACGIVGDRYPYPPPHIPLNGQDANRATNYSFPGVPYNCNVTIGANGGSKIVATETYAIPPGTPVGTELCRSLTVDPKAGAGSGPRTSAEACVTIVNKPFVSVLGGDAAAGLMLCDMSGSCNTADMHASIASWNGGSGSGWNAAGTQDAAFVTSFIQDFATGQYSSGIRPGGLAFANGTDGAENDSSGIFGGKFWNTTNAENIPNYFNGVSASSIHQGNVTLDPSTLASLGVANNSGVINNGVHKILYINGDVTIPQNITFSGSYANLQDIPSFYLAVSGNIYIKPGVTELDGVYIAQPTSGTNKGIIFTCTTIPSALAVNNAETSDANLTKDTASYYGTCNNPLTVYGSLTGQQVWFLRTSGTVGANTSAEQINLTPDIWLAPSPNQGSTGSTTPYDAITSLPPVL